MNGAEFAIGLICWVFGGLGVAAVLHRYGWHDESSLDLDGHWRREMERREQ